MLIRMMIKGGPVVINCFFNGDDSSNIQSNKKMRLSVSIFISAMSNIRYIEISFICISIFLYVTSLIHFKANFIKLPAFSTK